MAFWKNHSIASCVLQEISSTCVDSEPRGLALPVVTADKASGSMRTRLQKQLMTKSSLKALPEDAHYGAFK